MLADFSNGLPRLSVHIMIMGEIRARIGFWSKMCERHKSDVIKEGIEDCIRSVILRYSRDLFRAMCVCF